MFDDLIKQVFTWTQLVKVVADGESMVLTARARLWRSNSFEIPA